MRWTTFINSPQMWRAGRREFSVEPTPPSHLLELEFVGFQSIVYDIYLVKHFLNATSSGQFKLVPDVCF